MTTAEAFQRARRPEQKLQRRDAILGAARELARRDGVRTVSLAGIAAEVGIHKSALLRYFETREQIFLELTAEAWRDWARALHAGLDAASPGSAAMVADVFARAFADRPLFSVVMVNGTRRVTLPVDRLYAGASADLGLKSALPYCDCEVLVDRTYYLPLGDKSWPDDTLVEFEYMDDDNVAASK